MLYVTANNLGDAYGAALSRLMSESRRHEDPEIIREDVATVVVTGGRPLTDTLKRDEFGRLIDPFPYAACFPHVAAELIEKEMRCWNDLFVASGRLDGLISYLLQYPLSKRAIIPFWEDRFRDLSVESPCEIAVSFRLKSRLLEMHTHVRANNAAFLLLMDMRVLMGVQRLVAEALGVGVGDYVHFIDSLHVYEAELAETKKIYEIMSQSESRLALN